MSIENDAWDAVEKERGNYIDKAKLLDHIKREKQLTQKQHEFQSTSYDRQLFKGALSALRQLEHEIESGTFDFEAGEE